MKQRPLIVHSDYYIYVIENQDPDYYVEDKLNKFAWLVKAPEGVHTYRLDEYSLWSAAAIGLTCHEINNFLEAHSKSKISAKVREFITCKTKEFHTVDITYMHDDFAVIRAKVDSTMNFVYTILTSKLESLSDQDIKINIVRKENELIVAKRDVTTIKEILHGAGIFANEIVNDVREVALQVNVKLFEYQEKAVEAFENSNCNYGLKRHGVITMPPGTGKTLVGLKVIEKLKVRTLVLVENESSYDVWKEEIQEKTNLSDEVKEKIRFNELNDNISIVTYKKAQGDFLERLNNENWGLIIYDDAINLPTRESKYAAFLPSTYKLAMGSILERKDGHEILIFRAIGPKVYNLTLREMEVKGIQIPVKCIEIKLPKEYWDDKASHQKETLHTVAKNINKIHAYTILKRHFKNKKIVLVSTYVDIGEKFHSSIDGSYIIDHNVNASDRWQIIETLNSLSTYDLIATRVLDKLPILDVDVMISLSYIGASPREEYLRICKMQGSNLYKKKDGYYYALITENSCEEEKYIERRKSMINYGYKFRIRKLSDIEEGNIK